MCTFLASERMRRIPWRCELRTPIARSDDRINTSPAIRVPLTHCWFGACRLDLNLMYRVGATRGFPGEGEVELLARGMTLCK